MTAAAEGSPACIACREPIRAGATKCPHCGSSQRPERLRLVGALLKWIGGLTAVISLVIGAASVTQLYTGWRERSEAVDQLLAAARLELEAQDYDGGWTLLEDALRLNPSARTVRAFQVPFAIAWLRNIRVPAKSGFSGVVNRLLPVLYRGATDPDAVRAADAFAHIGWGNYLKWRDGDRQVDVELPYRRALERDPANPFAHVYWGQWLLNRHPPDDADVAAARQHFAAALQSGRAREYVVTIALYAWLDSPYKAREAEALRLAETARRAGEEVRSGLRAKLQYLFEALADPNDATVTAALARFTAGVPVDALAPLYRWIVRETPAPSGFDAVRRHYIEGRLLEAAGDRAGALALYRQIAASATPYTRFVQTVLEPAIARTGG